MFDCRIVFAVVLASTSGGLADSESELRRAIDVFGTQCAQVMDSPEGFYRSARSGGDESSFMITQSVDGLVHWIVRMEQREMLLFYIGQIDGKTRVSCQYSFIVDNPSQSTTDMNNDAFLAVISGLGEANATGGGMAVSGILSEQSGNPHTIYDYVISGWPNIEEVVSASVQEGWVRLDVAKELSRKLRLD